MNILFISHFVPYPPHGGALQRNYNLVREIARDNDIYLVTFTQKALLPTEEKLSASIEAVRPFCKQIKVVPIESDQNRIHRFFQLLTNTVSSLPFDVWRYYSKRMVAAIDEVLEKVDIDVVHIDTVSLAQYLRQCRGLPSVLNHHNIESTYLSRRATSESNPLARFYLHQQARKLKNYESRMTPRFNVNLTVSDLDSEDFRAFVPDGRFETIPNGTDVDYFTPRNPRGKAGLVYAGGLTYYPNIDAMCYFGEEVLPEIKKAVPDVRLTLIGRYPPRQIQLLAENEAAIDLLGYVEDLRDHIADAAVYIVPIRVGGGTRLKILDAMAQGKAIVSTSIGAEGLGLTNGHDIVIVDGAEQFAAAVVRLLQDGEERERLGNNARRSVEATYSWHVIGPRLTSLYKELAGVE